MSSSFKLFFARESSYEKTKTEREALKLKIVEKEDEITGILFEKNDSNFDDLIYDMREKEDGNDLKNQLDNMKSKECYSENQKVVFGKIKESVDEEKLFKEKEASIKEAEDRMNKIKSACINYGLKT